MEWNGTGFDGIGTRMGCNGNGNMNGMEGIEMVWN